MSVYHEMISRRDEGVPPNSLLVAHATLVSIGFMVLLPLGVLTARYRVLNPFWFNVHAFLQLLAGVFIVVGAALGIEYRNRLPLDVHTQHFTVGKVLLGLYIFQALLGLVIHYFKYPWRGGRRPPQNYLHALLGLTIIGLSFWQVRNGYEVQWPVFGNALLPRGVYPAWLALVVIWPVFYFAGLALLPKQYRQEAEKRAEAESAAKAG